LGLLPDLAFLFGRGDSKMKSIVGERVLFKELFKGTPEKFFRIAQQYSHHWNTKATRSGDGIMFTETQGVGAWLFHHYYFVAAQERPENKSQVMAQYEIGVTPDFSRKDLPLPSPQEEPPVELADPNIKRRLGEYVKELLEILDQAGWLEQSELDKPSDTQPPTKQPAGKRKKRREPSEDKRIQATLMTWAKKTGKCRSYAEAAIQLGSIDVDTRRNHEKHGWLYTPDEIEERGGYEDLWVLYTTTKRGL
jgi:hypothetical protein